MERKFKKQTNPQEVLFILEEASSLVEKFLPETPGDPQMKEYSDWIADVIAETKKRARHAASRSV